MVIITKIEPLHHELSGGTVSWLREDGSLDSREILLVANLKDGNMQLHVEWRDANEKPPPENTKFAFVRKK